MCWAPCSGDAKAAYLDVINASPTLSCSLGDFCPQQLHSLLSLLNFSQLKWVLACSAVCSALKGSLPLIIHLKSPLLQWPPSQKAFLWLLPEARIFKQLP